LGEPQFQLDDSLVVRPETATVPDFIKELIVGDLVRRKMLGVHDPGIKEIMKQEMVKLWADRFDETLFESLTKPMEQLLQAQGGLPLVDPD
jgi:hypothetical protein